MTTLKVPMKRGRMEIHNSETGPVELDVYGEIGWEFEPKEFLQSLRALPKDREIHVHINSPGGNIFDALPVFNLLRERREKVTAYVDGVALSAAALIAMAGQKTVMPRNARLMIHEAYIPMTGGTAEDLEKTAQLLRTENEHLVQVFQEKTGHDADQIRTWLKDTLWMDGPKAVELGFADALMDAPAKNLGDPNEFERSPEVPEGSFNITKPAHAAPNPNNTMNNNGTAPGSAPVAPAQEPQNINPEVVTKLTAELDRIQNALREERRARLKAELQPHLQGFTEEESARWLKLCEADENNIALLKATARLRSTVSETPAPPVNHHIEVKGASVLNKYNELKPGAKRLEFFKENFNDLIKAKPLFNPRGANTIATALAPDVLTDTLITVLGTRLGAFSAFITEVDLSVRKRSKHQVKFATVAPTTLVNPTSFTGGDSTLTNVEVSADQYVQPFHMSNADLQNGFRLADILQVNVQALAEKLASVMSAQCTTANFGTPLIIGAASNFDVNDLPAILADAKVKQWLTRYLALDYSYIARLVPLNTQALNWAETGAFDFTRIFTHNLWSGGALNLVGLAFTRQAFVQLFGMPHVDSDAPYDDITNVSLENGFTVSFRSWYDPATRIRHANLDAIYGIAKADANAGLLLTSA